VGAVSGTLATVATGAGVAVGAGVGAAGEGASRLLARRGGAAAAGHSC
jgi:hypothetical protein